MVWKLFEISILFCPCFWLVSDFVSMLKKTLAKKAMREKKVIDFTSFSKKKKSNIAS